RRSVAFSSGVSFLFVRFICRVRRVRDGQSGCACCEPDARSPPLLQYAARELLCGCNEQRDRWLWGDYQSEPFPLGTATQSGTRRPSFSPTRQIEPVDASTAPTLRSRALAHGTSPRKRTTASVRLRAFSLRRMLWTCFLTVLS